MSDKQRILCDFCNVTHHECGSDMVPEFCKDCWPKPKADIKWGQYWLNKKNQKVYKIHQYPLVDCTNSTEGRVLVVYWLPVMDGHTYPLQLFAREENEFQEKFEKIEKEDAHKRLFPAPVAEGRD